MICSMTAQFASAAMYCLSRRMRPSASNWRELQRIILMKRLKGAFCKVTATSLSHNVADPLIFLQLWPLSGRECGDRGLRQHWSRKLAVFMHISVLLVRWVRCNLCSMQMLPLRDTGLMLACFLSPSKSMKDFWQIHMLMLDFRYAQNMPLRLLLQPTAQSE